MPHYTLNDVHVCPFFETICFIIASTFICDKQSLKGIEMVTKKKMITLNIFLAEKKYSKNDFTFFLSKACKEYPITGIKGMTGACFIKEKKENAPKWKDFIEGIVGQKVDDLITKSSSAALLVKSKGRIFAITFGYGRCLIEQSYFVSDFGIKSALNMLRHDSLRSVDTFTIDDSPVQRKSQASSNIEISMFGLDITKDILRSVTGLPLKDVPFNYVCGGDNNLSVKIEMAPDDIPVYANECLKRYTDTCYLEQFSWVDNLKRVKVSQRIESLDNELIADIKKNNIKRINIVIPEVFDEAEIDSFTFTRSKSSPSHYIDKDIYFNGLDIASIDIEKIKRDKLFTYDSQGSEVKSFSIYKCLNYEKTINKKNYILFLGHWFEVDKEFVDDIETDLKAIPIHKDSFPKVIKSKDPKTNKDKFETEGDYNERISKSKGYILLDKKLVKSRKTTTAIELCDLADLNNKILIHTKQRNGGSSGLSHLFSQANVAAELMLSDQEFRKSARDVLEKNFGAKAMDLIPIDNIKSSEYEIVLLMLGANSKTVLKDLPFFSKVNLINTFSSLRQRGYKVSVAGTL